MGIDGLPTMSLFENATGEARYHDAIQRCANRDVEPGRPQRIIDQAAEYVKPEVVACLDSYGWWLRARPQRSAAIRICS